MMIPLIWKPFHWTGVDYSAYVNQAGQFISGQTFYPRIGAWQGPCAYPAANLWHYVFMYFIHMRTRYAIYIAKFLNSVMHSAIVIMVMRLARYCFRNHMSKVQLIGLMVVCNHNNHDFHLKLFNDSLMEFYVVLTMFTLVNDRPLTAAVLASLGTGIKTGAVIMLPALFGWTHFFYGTFTLLKSVSLFFSIHVFLAAPFCFEGAARLIGFGYEEISGV